ncbi:uncharacterized protein LOC134193284 [Corticium candelabrum]|uniref:uncharacterized protein LOC134193284 n=1 Tax=Corticium candelabrum TaxID=121492 RepID=UPI002E26E770|nr:uncharacterized protein LOC134193284 [Corticium candelabrum]
MQHGILWYNEEKEANKRQWIANFERQQQILQSIHDDTLGGCQLGRDKTREKKIFLAWCGRGRGLHIKTRATCQKTNMKFKKTLSELKPIKVLRPWHRIGIDLVGSLPVSAFGHKYIMTCIVYYTK